ncbi:MAG: type 1 glutamine amidotransferase [Flavipsychrobacter sp.]
MNLHYIQHVPFEEIGHIEIWARTRGCTISSTKMYLGEELPPIEQVDMLVILGGPMSIFDFEEHPWLREEREFIKRVIDTNKLVLGICLGAQLVSDILGASVYPSKHKEIGFFPIKKTEGASNKSELLNLLPDSFHVFHWHGDMFDITDNGIRLFHSEACKNQAYLQDNILCFQFHFEVTVENINNMLTHGRHELNFNKTYIQNEKKILSNLQHLNCMHMYLEMVLDRFIAQNHNQL